jgi:hypothetical protein
LCLNSLGSIVPKHGYFPSESSFLQKEQAGKEKDGRKARSDEQP